MNNDTLEGQARTIGGRVKETTGVLAGDDRLRGEGVADQVGGHTQKAVGSLRDAVAPLADQARGFAKSRPFAAAAVIGVLGIGLLNSLRKGRL